jgi:MFS family permease
VSTPSERAHPTRTLLILGTAALAFALAQTTLIPALPELMRGLDTDESGVTWTLTAYLVAAAVFTPLVGRLGDIFGKRRLLVISLLAFAAGSVVAAISASLWIVVAGRVIQGVGGGIFPLCFAIVRDEFPRERVARGVGLLSAIAGIGGGLGLILGGLLVDYASYHAIFWLSAAMGVAAAIAAEVFVPESPIRTPARLDIRGALVLAVGLGLLSVAHGTQLEVVAFALLMSAGIGLAFAAMPNLIIEAVPPHQTGEATGFNALVRSVGASLGSQVSATILAASAVAGVASDSGFSRAFAVSAVIAACAGTVALLIPRARVDAHAPVLDEIGAASPLAEPNVAHVSEETLARESA